MEPEILFPYKRVKSTVFVNEALGCKERNRYLDYLPIDTNGFKKPSYGSMTDSLKSLLEVSSSKLTTLAVYPVPEIGCDPYKYNLYHRRNKSSELVSLSFPSEGYDRRNEFAVGILDKFYEQNKNTFIPVRLRQAFCERGGIEACVVIEDSVPLYLYDDHISDAGADIVVEERLKALE